MLLLYAVYQTYFENIFVTYSKEYIHVMIFSVLPAVIWVTYTYTFMSRYKHLSINLLQE